MTDAAAGGDTELEALAARLIAEANGFRTDVYPHDFHGLDDRGAERGADGGYLLQFYAALALLAREMHAYLQEHPRTDAGLLEAVVDEVHARDAARWGDAAFPLYRGLPGEDLSLGLAEAAAHGELSFSILNEPTLIREWTTRPGALLHSLLIARLEALGLRGRICAKGGLLQQYEEHKINAPALQMQLVTGILTVSAASGTFWVPLAALVSVTLFKYGLRRYCRDRSRSGTDAATEPSPAS